MAHVFAFERKQFLQRAVIAALTVSASDSANGRSGSPTPPRSSVARIEGLPQEIQRYVETWRAKCGGPLAAGTSFDRYFANGRSGDRFIALHFNDLRCDNRAVCHATRCLHQVYAFHAGAYRLVWSEYVGDVEFRATGVKTELQTSSENAWSHRPTLFHWNGSRFVQSN
jgi:hypothetical protein